jgi:hypothetical protein
MDENEQRPPCTAIPGVPIPPSPFHKEITMAGQRFDAGIPKRKNVTCERLGGAAHG